MRDLIKELQEFFDKLYNCEEYKEWRKSKDIDSIMYAEVIYT